MKRKLKEDSRTYNKEKLNLLESYGPTVRPCELCGYPTLDGYICTYCGEDGFLPADQIGKGGSEL